MEAFSMLVPAGWSFEGGIRWSLENIMMPAAGGFKFSGDSITVQALPGRAFSWVSLPQVRRSHPLGSTYLGATFCPPLKAVDIIKYLILPSLRRDAEGLAITEESPASDIEGTLGFGATFKSCGSSSSEGARMRIEYEEDDKKYEEELLCTVTSFSYKIPAGDSNISFVIWMADHMFSFRAEKGKLDCSAGILQAMMHSFRLNPRWFEMYNRIVLFLKDRQMYRPYSLRQLSIDAGKAAIADYDAMGSYALRQSAYRWIACNLGRERATVEYYDPIQQVCVRLPAGYDHAWANDSGEYLLSDPGDFLPDSGFAEIWKMMEAISLDSSGGEPSTASVT